MNKYKRFVLFIGLLLIISSHSQAQDTIIRYKKVLIPNYINLQYAGNYGAYILGGGYYLNKKHTLQMVLGYGYSSKHKADQRMRNVFVKGIYVPKTWDLKKDWSFSVQTGITISRQFSGGANIFNRLPKTYPEGYYAPNAYRLHLNFGVKIRKNIGDDFFIKAIEFYAETTTNDLYLKYYFNYDKIGFNDIFSMAFGVNLILFNKN